MAIFNTVYGGSDARLPAEYQEVERIWWTNWSDSIAQVYIDTWYIPSETTWCNTQMLHTATRDNIQWFTALISDNTTRRWLTTYPSWKWCPQRQTWHQTNVGYSVNIRYDIKLNYENNKQTLIDWTNIYSLWSWTFSPMNSIRIWDITYNGYWRKCKFFKISNWTELVRYFIPCYKKSTWAIWMFDVVNKVFYTNAGTWTLTKWPDVN
jgi:hypothetical protein